MLEKNCNSITNSIQYILQKFNKLHGIILCVTESVQYDEKEGKSRFIASSYLTIRPLVQDHGTKFACEAFHKALDHRMRNEVTLSVLRK